MLLSHRIRIEANSAQRDYFARAAGTARRVWNWALAEWQRQAAAGQRPNAMALKKQFNAIKYAHPDWQDQDGQPWLRRIHRDTHAQPFAHLARAFSRYFSAIKARAPAHPPRFKRKGRCRDSFYVANDKFRIEGKAAVLPKVGRVGLAEALRLTGKIMGASVSREADWWFLAVQVEVPEHLARRRRSGDGVVGVDLGITAAAALSTGEKVQAPRPLKGALRRLRMRGRRLSRKLEAAKRAAGIAEPVPRGTRLPVSKNRTKGARALARLHARIARVRADWTHQLTNRLCRENQAVAIEDLNVKAMLANARLARAIADIGFYQVRRQLHDKAQRYGMAGACAGGAGRPLVSVEQAVFGVRREERDAWPGPARVDLRRLRRLPRPRHQRRHQFETARNRRPRGAPCATRGEPGGNAWHCRRRRFGGRRESHACQARTRSAGRFGAGRECCALVRTFLIAGQFTPFLAGRERNNMYAGRIILLALKKFDGGSLTQS